MRIIYHPKVKTDDLPRLSPDMALRIRNAIEQRLMVDPIKFGFFLHGSLRGYRKLRVGDWRIVYRVVGQEVRIVAIGHRKDSIVYRIALSRI